MATGKTAKKAGRGGKTAAKKSSSRARKTRASATAGSKPRPAPPARKAAKKSPAKKPPASRSAPFRLDADDSNVQISRSGSSETYDIFVLIAEDKLSQAQKDALQNFVDLMGLNPTSICKGWGGP